MENLPEYLKRWLKAAVKNIDDEIKKQADIHGCDLKESGTQLVIERQEGKKTGSFSGTYVFIKDKKRTPLLRLEFDSQYYNMFVMPKKTRGQRRKEERKEAKIINLVEKDTIKLAKDMGEAELEQKAQKYLKDEEKRPTTTTDPLKH